MKLNIKASAALIDPLVAIILLIIAIIWNPDYENNTHIPKFNVTEINNNNNTKKFNNEFKMKSKSELRKYLKDKEYKVTQLKETEKPFTGEYNNHKEKGIYKCKICSQELFDSKTKYDSGSGCLRFMIK